jgi:ABC-type Fe3+ transport system permease subunit/sugar lactone lactonase YvrE
MNWVLLRNSLLVGGFTTLLSVTLGFLSALWLAGLNGRLRTGVLGAAILALALPPFLVTNCWLHFLGRTGVWHSWLPLNIFSLGGTVWVLTLLLWPLSLLLVWGAWQRLEPEQLESDMMVCGWALLRALLLPLAATALAQAAILTFVLALNNFAVPAILQVKVFPAEMWIRFNTEFDTLGALRLCWPLVIGPFILLIWFSRRELPWLHLQPAVPAQLFRQQLGPVWFWFSGFVSLLLGVLAVGLPLFQILSVRRTWTELPGALAAGQSAVWNSLWYASAAATVILGISLCGACLKGRRPKSEIRKKAEGRRPKEPNQVESNRGIRGIHGNPKAHASSSVYSAYSAVHNPEESGLHVATQSPSARPFGFRPSAFFRISAFGLRISFSAAWLAFLLPGVLLGIGLIHVFNHDWSALFYQSAGIVILAYVIRYLVVGWHSAVQAVRRVDRDLTDVALLEGAGRWQMLRYVQWPQIARSMFVVWYIVFLLCLWDVESMILVVPPGGETLALRIFNLLHYGHNSQVNALCFVLLGVALLPLALGMAVQKARSAYCVLRGACCDQSTHHAPRTTQYGTRNILLASAGLLLLTSCTPGSNQATLHSQIFDSVQIIGTRGVGVGQLNKPRSVAVDPQDNLYVVDTTGRVQKFSSSGVFLLSWQMPEIERGKPKGMGHDRDGNIIVVEPHYSRVNLFSTNGTLLAQWGSHGTNAGQFSLPRAVAVNSRAQIFVSEYEEIERVQEFVFGPGDSRRPVGLGAPSLRQPPHWVTTIGHAGTGPGEFNRAEGLCFDAQDRLYVADSCNHRIQVFSSDGKFLRAYGKPGQGPGEFSYPYDICVDKDGRQYVCEFGNSRIQVFDAQDRLLEIIGGPGAEPGRFSNPWALALDSVGNLYVADSQNHRVQKLKRRQ